jgi:hypothetical protein
LNGLKDVLAMYPEFADRCAVDLVHDLTYNLRDGYVDPEDEGETIAPAITLPSIVEETTDDEDDANDDVNDDDVETEEFDDDGHSMTASSGGGHGSRYQAAMTKRRSLTTSLVSKSGSDDDGLEESNCGETGNEDEDGDEDGGGSESDDGMLEGRFGTSSAGAAGGGCAVPLLGSPLSAAASPSMSAHGQVGCSASHSPTGCNQGLQTSNSDLRYNYVCLLRTAVCIAVTFVECERVH